MRCDNCRWFNKQRFALGIGDCVLHRCVHSAKHEACEHYEEYEQRPHGEWIDTGDIWTETYNGFESWGTSYKCSECGNQVRLKKPFCYECGADMRKEGEAE